MRQLNRPWHTAVSIISLLWSGFLLYTALRFAFHPMLQGAICVGIALVLVFILCPMNEEKSPQNRPSIFDVILMAISALICIYVAINFRYFEEYAAQTMSTGNSLLGLIMLLLLLEGARRSVGKVVPIITLTFFAYIFLGKYIPGHWGHGGFKPMIVMWQLFQTTNGYWGVVTDVITRVVIIFIIFGPILFATGAGESFVNLANLVGGRIRGGAAQIAVISSASFGMFSGAALANVSTTGAFTIPTMKKAGYKPAFAGAVESAASTGGQIMPPIMGTSAFIMAEFLARPYLEIMIAAFIPAFLFYLGIASGVFFEASRLGLSRLPAEMVPKARQVLHWRSLMPVVVPLAVLLYFLADFYPAQNCAGWAIVTSVGLYLLTGGRLTWVEVKERLRKLMDALVVGIRSLSWLVVMIVCIQAVVCLIALSGFGVKFTGFIMSVGQDNIFLALLMTMIAAIILGMGMPTVAAYVIAISVIGPMLGKLGLPLLSAHLFVFYYAIVSCITPPVAPVTYPASALAGAPWISIAWIAMRLAIVGYIVPYFFVFNEPLLMVGSPLQIVVTTFFSILGVVCLSAGLIGYLLKMATIPERLIFITAGIFFLVPSNVYHLAAVVLVLVGLASQKFMPPIAFFGRQEEAGV